MPLPLSLTSACRCDDQQQTKNGFSSDNKETFILPKSVRISVVGHRNGKPKLKTQQGQKKITH